MWILSKRYRMTVLRALRLSLHWKLWFYCDSFTSETPYVQRRTYLTVGFLPPYHTLAIPCPERADRRTSYTLSSERPLDTQNMQSPSNLETIMAQLITEKKIGRALTTTEQLYFRVFWISGGQIYSNWCERLLLHYTSPWSNLTHCI